MVSRSKYYLLFTLFISITVIGCMGTTPKAVYYTLNSIEENKGSPSTAAARPIAIGIGPVKFPDELDRPSIVTRSGRNRLVVNEFHRWGGSLEKNFTRVMMENLAHLMKTDQVMARPWERYFQPDVRIALDIRRFDGRLGEYALLNVTWMMYEKDKDNPAITRRTSIREPVAEEGYDAFVAAQSRLIGRLCQEIAQVLSKGLPKISD